MKKGILNTIQTWLAAHWEKLLHAAGWFLVFLTMSEIWFSQNLLKVKIIHSYSIIASVFVFYVNILWLIPAFLKKKRWATYLMALITIVAAMLSAGILIHLGVQGEDSDDLGLLLGLMILGVLFALVYIFTRDWVLNLGYIEKLKSEKLEVELAFLKSQVDPHFLFNTLNTLYALALEEKAGKTADAIAKLGTLMRYNLHDSQVEFVSLGKEMDFIEKYITLQQLRVPERCRIEWVMAPETESWMDKKIAPMLLIPFVENAFKHGVSLTDDTFIHIHFAISEEMLVLTIKNSILPGSTTDERTGIGLQNVKSRLDLLYPGQHDLAIDHQKGIHTTRLEINLHP
ncbi:MAG: histidine kinase [Bacteroidia bacterium]